jgi:hypothetical protein
MWLKLGFISALLVMLVTLPYQATKPPFNTGRVTFERSEASPLNAVASVGLQTHTAIGIVFGQHQQTLCDKKHSFSINDQLPKDALARAVAGTGYSVRERSGVFVIAAPDIPTWQRRLLTHRYPVFKAEEEMTMQVLGAQLTGWMWVEVGHAKGYGASIMGSLSAEQLKLGVMKFASTEEIANRIVSLGSKGIWLLKADKSNASSPMQESITTYSYHDDTLAIQTLSCKQ